jgi:hypothetical protein
MGPAGRWVDVRHDQGVTMEFVQVIEYETTKYEEVRAIGQEFAEKRRNEGGPKPVSILFCQDRDRPNTYATIARFASYEEAMQNSESPDTSEMAGRIAALCDNMRFYNLDVLDSITP